MRNEQINHRSAAELCQALADPSRVRAAMALWWARQGRVVGVEPGVGEGKGELCACQIVALLGLADSTVSRHLQVLRLAGLVEATKRGRWMHYRLSDPDEHPGAHAVLAAVARGVGDAESADLDRLSRIMAMDAEALCSLQRDGQAIPGSVADNGGSACCSSVPATHAAAKWPRDGHGRS